MLMGTVQFVASSKRSGKSVRFQDPAKIKCLSSSFFLQDGSHIADMGRVSTKKSPEKMGLAVPPGLGQVGIKKIPVGKRGYVSVPVPKFFEAPVSSPPMSVKPIPPLKPFPTSGPRSSEVLFDALCLETPTARQGRKQGKKTRCAA